jgi:hypothetical protein
MDDWILQYSVLSTLRSQSAQGPFRTGSKSLAETRYWYTEPADRTPGIGTLYQQTEYQTLKYTEPADRTQGIGTLYQQTDHQILIH